MADHPLGKSRRGADFTSPSKQRNRAARQAVQATAKMKTAVATGTPGLRRKRVSIDCGPADWPTEADVGNFAPPIRARINYPELVEEIRMLEMAIPEQISIFTEEGEKTAEPVTLTKEDSKAVGLPRGTVATPMRIHRKKVRIPTASELFELPPQLAAHIEEAGRQTLNRLYLPLLLMRQKSLAKRKLTADRGGVVPKVPEDFLARLPLFKTWPADALSQVVSAMEFRAYDAKEFIVYEREPASAMLFLVNGAVHVLQRTGPGVPYSGRNLASQQTVTTMTCFGEMNLLTDEPWQQALRAVNRADMWILTKPKFEGLLKKMQPHVVNYIIRTAFHRRNETMKSKFPVTVDMLRHQPLFAPTSADFLRDLIDRLEPHALPKDYTLCEEGTSCTTIYYVVHGSVAQLRKVGDAMTHIATLTAGGLIGASAMAHGASSEGTFKTLIDSDIYILSKNSFNILSRQYPNDLDLILEAARSQRHEEITSNQARYAGMVQNIPLLRDLLPSYFVKDFVPLLQPKSYRPLSSVCSTASFCDRLIIVTKGQLRLSDGYEVKVNDCLGWTCCVPHRWGQGAITMNLTAEVLEVPCQDFMEFLHEKHLLNTFIKQTKMIMFPKAFPKQQVDVLLAQIGPHPIFYPVSKSRVVNHNEQGFCTVHMHLLEEHQREETLKKKKQEEETPPSYKKLSQGVWIPRQRQVRGFTTRK